MRKEHYKIWDMLVDAMESYLETVKSSNKRLRKAMEDHKAAKSVAWSFALKMAVDLAIILFLTTLVAWFIEDFTKNTTPAIESLYGCFVELCIIIFLFVLSCFMLGKAIHYLCIWVALLCHSRKKESS